MPHFHQYEYHHRKISLKINTKIKILLGIYLFKTHITGKALKWHAAKTKMKLLILFFSKFLDQNQGLAVQINILFQFLSILLDN